LFFFVFFAGFVFFLSLVRLELLLLLAEKNLREPEDELAVWYFDDLDDRLDFLRDETILIYLDAF
jgi:hypothetical protein